MKKVMILSIALLAAIALVAPAHAGVDWVTGSNIELGKGSNDARPAANYGLSSNVYLYYTTEATHQNYVLGAGHFSGNREYGSANSTTLIYYQTRQTGKPAIALPTPPSATLTFSTSWTAL
jgi:hypothetical protein